jgi:hypothetical protein
MAAIAPWQQRRLAEIDAQLRELGIENIAALEEAMAKVTEDHRARQVGEIEAALQTLAEYQCVIVPEAASDQKRDEQTA